MFAYISVAVAVVLGAVSVEVDRLHGPHEGVPHPHPVLRSEVSPCRHPPTFMTTSRSWADTTPSLTSRQHSFSRAYWGIRAPALLILYCSCSPTSLLLLQLLLILSCSRSSFYFSLAPAASPTSLLLLLLHLHPVEYKAWQLPRQRHRSLTYLRH